MQELLNFTKVIYYESKTKKCYSRALDYNT